MGYTKAEEMKSFPQGYTVVRGRPEIGTRVCLDCVVFCASISCHLLDLLSGTHDGQSFSQVRSDTPFLILGQSLVLSDKHELSIHDS